MLYAWLLFLLLLILLHAFNCFRCCWSCVCCCCCTSGAASPANTKKIKFHSAPPPLFFNRLAGSVYDAIRIEQADASKRRSQAERTLRLLHMQRGLPVWNKSPNTMRSASATSAPRVSTKKKCNGWTSGLQKSGRSRFHKKAILKKTPNTLASHAHSFFFLIIFIIFTSCHRNHGEGLLA